MYTIRLKEDDTVYCSYPTPDGEESENDKLIFAELPIEIINRKDDEIVIYNRSTELFSIVKKPPRPKTELEILREENAELRVRDSQLQDDNNFIIEALINAGII